jgi:hypothetical protein
MASSFWLYHRNGLVALVAIDAVADVALVGVDELVAWLEAGWLDAPHGTMLQKCSAGVSKEVRIDPTPGQSKSLRH